MRSILEQNCSTNLKSFIYILHDYEFENLQKS